MAVAHVSMSFADARTLRGEDSDQSHPLPVRAFESPFVSPTFLLLPVPSGEDRAQTGTLSSLEEGTWGLSSHSDSLLQATRLVREPASDLGLWTLHALPSKGWLGVGREGRREETEGGEGWLSRQELGDPALREAEGGLYSQAVETLKRGGQGSAIDKLGGR